MIDLKALEAELKNKDSFISTYPDELLTLCHQLRALAEALETLCSEDVPELSKSYAQTHLAAFAKEVKL